MPAVETGSDKVKKICEVLRKETLDPAISEAEETVKRAKKEAEQIIAEAKSHAEKLVENTEAEIEKKKAVFHASMQQGCRQTLEQLKEDIEERLFSPALAKLIEKKTSEPETLASLVNAVVQAVEKEGLSADLSAAIANGVSAEAVNQLLLKEVAQALKEKGVVIGPIKGGIEVRLHDEKITVDVTAQALQEMVEEYLRGDLRQLLFGSTK